MCRSTKGLDMKHFRVLLAPSCGLIITLVVATSSWSAPIDEAKAEGKTTADFPKITEDVFKPMDQGSVVGELTEEEIRDETPGISGPPAISIFGTA